MKTNILLTGILLLFSSSVFSQISTTGLVAFYPFNGNAKDSTGNDHNGVVSGATLTTDRFGKTNNAYSFNGSSDYIEISSANTLRFSEYTYEAWIYPTANPTGGIIANGGATILDIGGEIGDQVLNIGNFLGAYIGIGGFGYYLGGGTHNTQTGVLPALDQWYHVVGTRSNTHYKLFINGVLIQSISLLPIAPEYDVSTIGFIGKRIGDIQYFNGKIDDVRIYNSPLTEVQVKELYINESLVAWYPFNGNANDESGNGNHGTITGALVTPAVDRYGEEGKAYKFWFPDYISVPTNSSFFSDEFTVSYWYKVQAYWGDRGVLSCVGNKGGYQQVFSAGTTFTYLLGYNFPTGSWFWTNYSVSNTPNTWQHITTTYKKTGDNLSISKLYLNGELKSSEVYANSIAYPGSEIFYIGRNHSELGLNGELDDVRFYNRVLTDAEVLALHATELPNAVNSQFISNISISPNPTDGHFLIDLGSNYQNIKINISDITGRTLKEMNFSNVQKLNQKIEAPSGIYFINIITEKEKATFKLIKN